MVTPGRVRRQREGRTRQHLPAGEPPRFLLGRPCFKTAKQTVMAALAIIAIITVTTQPVRQRPQPNRHFSFRFLFSFPCHLSCSLCFHLPAYGPGAGRVFTAGLIAGITINRTEPVPGEANLRAGSPRRRHAIPHRTKHLVRHRAPETRHPRPQKPAAAADGHSHRIGLRHRDGGEQPADLGGQGGGHARGHGVHLLQRRLCLHGSRWQPGRHLHLDDVDPRRQVHLEVAALHISERLVAQRKPHRVARIVGERRHRDPLDPGRHRDPVFQVRGRELRDKRADAQRQFTQRRGVHIDSHRIRRHTVVRAVVHPEGETRSKGAPAFVHRGDVFQGADLGRGHRLRQFPRRKRRARERERAPCRQRYDLHARESVAHIIPEAEVGAGEGVRVLGRGHRPVRRGRRGVGAGGQHRPARRVGVAGERVLVGSIVVLKRDLHPDRLALVVGNQRVSAGRRARNVGVGAARHPDPLETGVSVRQKGVRQPVQIRDGAHRRHQRPLHPRGARDPRLAHRRVVHRRHIDGHRIRRGTVVRAVVHPEGETRQGGPVFVRRGDVFQGADLGRGHRLLQGHRRNRRAREREHARRRQRYDLHARKRVAHIRIREGKVGAGEGVRRVLVRDHHLVRRGRRIVGAGGQHRRARRVGVAGERAHHAAAPFVLERDLDPDLLAIVGVNQRVSTGRRARNVGVGPARHPDPLEAGAGVRQKGVRQPVRVRDGAHRRHQHLVHPRGARDPRLAHRRVVHRRHIDSHRIRPHTVVRAVVHPEGETRQGDPAFVRRGDVFQGADLGRGHRLRQVPRRKRRARERERARRRQRYDLHARERSARIRIREGKVGAGEGVLRVLGRDHRLVRRGRRVVHRHHIDSHRIRRGTVGRAVVHPEGECNPKVAVRHGGVFQVAGGELGRGHRLRQVPRRNRRARKRERARRRQRYDLHARERSARIRIRERKVGAGEGVLRVLGRDHRLVRRGRRSVGGLGLAVDADEDYLGCSP